MYTHFFAKSQVKPVIVEEFELLDDRESSSISSKSKSPEPVIKAISSSPDASSQDIKDNNTLFVDTIQSLIFHNQGLKGSIEDLTRQISRLSLSITNSTKTNNAIHCLCHKHKKHHHKRHKKNTQAFDAISRLREALNHSDIPRIRTILNTQFYVNNRDKNGSTVLHYAAELGSPKLVNVLLEEFNADKSVRNGNGHTPFDLALDRNHFQAAKLLK